MRIENFKQINKGALVAKFDVIIEQWALTIRECTLFAKDGRQWVGFPARQYKDAEGANKHFNFLYMEKEAKGRFDAAVIKQLPQVPVETEIEVDVPF